MPRHNLLQNYHFSPADDDIRGAPVFDRSENNQLGTVSDVIVDLDSGQIDYIVVSADNRLVLLPSRRVWLAGDGFAADLDRDQFVSLPDFDEQILSDQNAWDDYQDLVREAWVKIGEPTREPRLEQPPPNTEPTLWDRFRERVSTQCLERAREEREIERFSKRPEPGKKIA
jgi:sporulation protein YlmC with PRC-barrel domain